MIYEATDYWNSSYISHHGVKGMKWGVRHDNKVTGQKSNNLKKEKMHNYINNAFTPGKKGKPSNAEKVARASENTINPLKNITRSTQKRKQYDVSRMSDDELRRRINRLEMERRYNDLRNSNLSPGRQKVMNILDLTGNVLAIGVSAATIATAAYQIKNINANKKK